MTEPFLLVLDDDPTGSQTVAGVPVVTTWEPADLRWLLSTGQPMGFVLTNSRSLPPAEAAETSATIVSGAIAEARRVGRGVRVLSRSDSTLRGHFTAELQAICRASERSGEPVDLIVFAPAFFEAGRTTTGDVHYVAGPGGPLPVGDTVYAGDPTFGFSESNLVSFASARWPPDPPVPGTDAPGAPLVASIGLEEARLGGADRVAERLLRACRMAGGWPPVVVVNGTAQDDYLVVAEAVRRLEAEGLNVASRCGPSWVASMLGSPTPPPISALPAIPAEAGNGGLVVVGSHVSTTSAQLTRLLEEMALPLIELDPEVVLGAGRDDHVRSLAGRVADQLAFGDVVLATGRRLLADPDPGRSLKIASAVAAALDSTVRLAIEQATPSWIIAKGGITSALMLRSALGIRRGWIAGQVLSGLLPVWSSTPPGAGAGRREGATTVPPCVIFPGNVGDEGLLAEVVRRLRGAAGAPIRD